MQQILVDISPEGEVKVQAEGVTGSGCKELTKALEQALGKTVSDQKKPEFFAGHSAGQGLSAGAR